MAQSDRMSAGGTLEELWKSGRQGNLCPLEQVRAIALRDAYTDLPGALPKSGGQAALLSAIAGRVAKIGGGHPSKQATRSLLERYDVDLWLICLETACFACLPLAGRVGPSRASNAAQAPTRPLAAKARNSNDASLKNILGVLNDELRNELRTSFATSFAATFRIHFMYDLL